MAIPNWTAASWACFVPTRPERTTRPPRIEVTIRYGAVLGLDISAFKTVNSARDECRRARPGGLGRRTLGESNQPQAEPRDAPDRQDECRCPVPRHGAMTSRTGAPRTFVGRPPTGRLRVPARLDKRRT